MEKKITGYTTVDISQWHRKEHFEAFQSVAQCTYNQTVQLDITAFLKTVKKNKHKFYPAFIHILARLMNAHPEFRMAMKDGELVIWDSVHPCYTVFHEQTETFSSLWSEYHDDFRQFLHIYSQDVACYGENLAYFPKGFIENMFFVSANPWVSFTSFDLNVANMDNFFAPVFTMGKYYTQGDKVLMPLAIQVHHAVCDGFHVGRMLNELQQLLVDIAESLALRCVLQRFLDIGLGIHRTMQASSPAQLQHRPVEILDRDAVFAAVAQGDQPVVRGEDVIALRHAVGLVDRHVRPHPALLVGDRFALVGAVVLDAGAGGFHAEHENRVVDAGSDRHGGHRDADIGGRALSLEMDARLQLRTGPLRQLGVRRRQLRAMDHRIAGVDRIDILASQPGILQRLPDRDSRQVLETHPLDLRRFQQIPEPRTAHAGDRDPFTELVSHDGLLN